MAASQRATLSQTSQTITVFTTFANKGDLAGAYSFSIARPVGRVGRLLDDAHRHLAVTVRGLYRLPARLRRSLLQHPGGHGLPGFGLETARSANLVRDEVELSATS